MPRILPHRRRRPVSNVRSRVAGRSRYPAARTLGERASGREPMSGRRKWLGLFGGLAVVLAAIAAVAIVHAVREHEEGEEESLSAFVREHDGQRLRRLPIAVVREKLEHGKEAQREKISGPAQAQVDERAFPRTVVTAAQARDARAAFLDQSPAGLADPFVELGPFVPRVPREVTYTGAPTTNSGRVTALAVDPNCGRPGKACRAWMAAAGGGIWRTGDALAGSGRWTPATNGLTTGAFGSLVVDPTDATGNTLYAGSGEPNGSSDSEAGVGLFRSTDGGATWSLVPGSAAVARDRSIGSIAINPDDGTIWIGTDLARHGSSSSNGGRRPPPRPAALHPARRSSVCTSPPTAARRSRSRSPRRRARRTRRRAPTSSRAASTRSSSTRRTPTRSTRRSSATASGARRRAWRTATTRSSRSS